jgi:hypothetical protein
LKLLRNALKARTSAFASPDKRFCNWSICLYMSGPPTSISALPIHTDADVSVTEEAVDGIEKDGETFNGLTRPSAAPAIGEEGEGGEGGGGGRVDEPALLPA